MDRVDGLVAAASAVGLAGFVINVHSPAHALLARVLRDWEAGVPAVRAGRMAVVPAATSRPGAMPAPKRVSVLGATGSVGTSTLDLIGRNPHLFEVVALTAHSNVEALAELRAAPPRRARRRRRREPLSAPRRSGWRAAASRSAAGAAALIEAAERPADCVMAGISGAAGLRPDAGRRDAGPPRGARQQGMPGHRRARSSWRPCARPAPSWCRWIRSTPPSSRRSPAPIPPPSSASC